MEKSKLEKVIEAAKLYYLLDYSQQDIADKLGISRPSVSRLLQQAKEEGIVQIKIVDPYEDNEKIADELENKLNLKKVMVASVPKYDEETVKKYIGDMAASYLNKIVSNEDIIGVSWGTTIYQVAKSLKYKHLKDVTVVQLNGGVSHSKVNTYASEIMGLFGKAFNTNPYYLPLPAIVDHLAVKQAVEADRHIRKVMELAKDSKIAVFTVGIPSTNSVLIQAKYFSEEDLKIIRNNAVGDICSRFINRRGDIFYEDLNKRTIGIELSELKKKKWSILVAGGPNRLEAIYGAIQGGYANALITDKITANLLLDIHKDGEKK
ncbi:sugar-binding transcriptional regulator [Clostridium thailandense]|uniref:Sugar-binding transcriptional regulator n=1 Tax=Clostridium thailandense TaxID=2794346 RepID=A0A949TW63_9CLOT|nr:sugar-binding transcriptional regulator [Clostridium thailandense]MBV7273578.1 sugar-binding transcriptional regulator [Clostridium thailandense]MCH5137106.1 sugar-binding transcriptional regulator [Clostridiaceae bacterium UIB06]